MEIHNEEFCISINDIDFGTSVTQLWISIIDWWICNYELWISINAIHICGTTDLHNLIMNLYNSSLSQIPRYLVASGSQRPNPEHAFHRHGHFVIGLIDCQTQLAPTLIGQRWSTISASTRYPRLNPLWLVTHCTLSHAHHSFQSHMYHLACMEMAKFSITVFSPTCTTLHAWKWRNFLCAIFNWLKLFYCNGVTSPKPLS